MPKLTVVLRKAYGAGYFVMCGRAYEPALIRGLAMTRGKQVPRPWKKHGVMPV